MTEEESTGGVGSRNKPKRSIERYLEIEGGDAAVKADTISDIKNPFNIDNVLTMREKRSERLQKSKDKDAAKMANTKEVNENDLPF